jgi:putative transposase
MTRPLRVDDEGGWYHTTCRGINKAPIWKEDADRLHFLGLLEAMVERFHVRVHAYVLMTNHYHLLLETPHANASRAMQWLNVSYSVWYNRKRNRCGPLFQGRFKSVLVDQEGVWALEASVYIHLNPVRLARHGAGKREQTAARAGLGGGPTDEQVRAQLAELRAFAWSSYPAYAGWAPKPRWLTCEELWKRAVWGKKEPQAAYREWVEDRITQGEPVEMDGRVTAGLVFGGTAFLEKVRGWLKGREIRGESEKPQVRALRRWVPFETIKAAVERVHGERWAAFKDRRGDWGRDVALVLAHRLGGMTYPELARVVGMKSQAVAAAIRLMGIKLADAGSVPSQKMREAKAAIQSLQTL